MSPSVLLAKKVGKGLAQRALLQSAMSGQRSYEPCVRMTFQDPPAAEASDNAMGFAFVPKGICFPALGKFRVAGYHVRRVVAWFLSPLDASNIHPSSGVSRPLRRRNIAGFTY